MDSQWTQMGLDTVNVEVPMGLPRLLWALFTHIKAAHIQSHTSAAVKSNFNSTVITYIP